MKIRPINQALCGIAIVAVLLHFRPSVEPVDGQLVGLRVLVVEETADRSSLPRQQALIFTSSEIREYLDNHCGREQSGAKGYRFFDDDTPMEHETQAWRDLMAKAKDKPRPTIVISKWPKNYVGPLPKDIASTLTLLRKYGG